jgi:iron complex transport system permease protein
VNTRGTPSLRWAAHPPRARLSMGLLTGLLLLVSCWGLGAGALGIGVVDAGRAALAGAGLPVAADDVHVAVVTAVRGPRVALAAVVGAAFGLAGALAQGLFRNPLADPGLVGVLPGALLGAAAGLVLGSPLGLGAATMPVGSAVGGLVATVAVWQVGAGRGTATLLLAGVAIGAVCSALMGLLLFLADEVQLASLTFWTLGSLGGASWPVVGMAAAVLGVAAVAVLPVASALDALALGEDVAGHLGVDVRRLWLVAVALVAALVGAGVASAGAVGFVGLVVPHLVRLVDGPAHRHLLPASALLGAVLLVVADTAARTLVAPAELPLGTLTAAAGAPFFLWLVARRAAEVR